MNSEALIDRLAANADLFRAQIGSVAPAQGSWKPATGSSAAEPWSILEVVNHLCDEEREDFRTRIDLTLHRPEADWPRIDPQGWVKSRAYAQRELVPSLEAFLRERSQSVAWLCALSAPDWGRTHTHPIFGGLSAGDLLASWVAHDFLHLRQLARLQFQYASLLAEPYSTRYAGEW